MIILLGQITQTLILYRTDFQSFPELKTDLIYLPTIPLQRNIFIQVKNYIIRIMVFPLDDNFVCFGQKKILSQEKKNIHQQMKLLIQRKHHYAYDISFLCHPLLKFSGV